MKEDLENAFLSTLEQSQEKIFRVCVSYTKNTQDAKDLFQEVLVNIWKALPNFKGDALLSTYIYRITINVCLRFQKNLIKGRSRFISANNITIEHVESTADDAQNEKKLMLLRSCVRGLNDVDKAVITLFLEELSYREISLITGLKENTVAVRIKRIKKKLLDCIKEKL